MNRYFGHVLALLLGVFMAAYGREVEPLVGFDQVDRDPAAALEAAIQAKIDDETLSMNATVADNVVSLR